MAGDPEKRFERAMNRLFPTKAPSPCTASAASSIEASSSRIAGDALQNSGLWQPTKALGSGTTANPRFPSAAVLTSIVRHDSVQPLCRPWDRGDLLRRLATFKSISWFGKPQVTGPVACARRGWVNVDVDLLACEGCGARLSFPLPPSWSRTQVDSAAETFAKQLDSGHKALCAWKGNACSDALALFPPTPPGAIVGDFYDRCESLLQLSALPLISRSAIDTFKLLKGPQFESLLTQPPPVPPSFAFQDEHVTAAESGERSENGYSCNGFYKAQRIIALCGWVPRLLPYIVDAETVSSPSTKDSLSEGPIDAVASRRYRDSGPSILLVSAGRGNEKSETADNIGRKQDASAVLECSLCGASVGLWGFSTIRKPLAVLGAVLPERSRQECNALTCGLNIPSCMDGDSTPGPCVEEAAELRGEAGNATKVRDPVGSSAPGGLNLRLTIAGGPPPTQLSSLAIMPPAFGPIPALQPRSGQPESSEVGICSSSHELPGPRDQVLGANSCRSTVDTSSGRPLPAYSAEGTVTDHDVEDGELGNGADSLKRKRTKNSAVDQPSEGATLAPANADVSTAMDAEVQGGITKRRKRTEASGETAGTSVHYSMSNGDGHRTVNENDKSDQVERFGVAHTVEVEGREGGSRVVLLQVESVPVNTFEVECNEGAEMNGASTSIGPNTVGGANVGMEGDIMGMEAQIRAEVHYADVSGHLTTDGAALNAEVTGNKDTKGEFIQDKGLIDTSVNEDKVKRIPRDVRGDSDEVMLSQHAGKVCSNDKPTPQGESEESRGQRGFGNSRGKRRYGEGDDQTEDEGTVDTTKAVILCGDSSQEAIATEGHNLALIEGDEDHGCTTVNGPGRSLEEFLSDTNTREFNPIRQHRHFCPWINEHVAAVSNNSTFVCGWQLTLDALHAHHHQSAHLAEAESTSSVYRGNALTSVRKLMGTSKSERARGSRLLP